MVITASTFRSCTLFFCPDVRRTKEIREKTERISSTLTGLATSVNFKSCSQSAPPSVFVLKSGRRSSSHSNSFSRFLLLCFLGIKCHVLDSKAAVEVGGSQDYVLQHYEWAGKEFGRLTEEGGGGGTWNILCGLTYSVVVKTVSVI